MTNQNSKIGFRPIKTLGLKKKYGKTIEYCNQEVCDFESDEDELKCFPNLTSNITTTGISITTATAAATSAATTTDNSKQKIETSAIVVGILIVPLICLIIVLAFFNYRLRNKIRFVSICTLECLSLVTWLNLKPFSRLKRIENRKYWITST